MNTFVFDIETVPDVNAGRLLYDFHNLDAASIGSAMTALQRQNKDSGDFLPHYLQRIVAISVALRTSTSFKVWSLGNTDSTEAELLQRFFAGLDKFTPVLVSWNGGSFDLPVIHYRSLLHGVASPRYWEAGENDSNFRWNNYLNRYHERHTDLMDVLAGFQTKANAPLDKIATLLGFPGKMGMHGSLVGEYYLAGRLQEIRDYCETDVLNTYLVYQRFQLIRGKITLSQFDEECLFVKEYLIGENKPHFEEFLLNWG
jgi:predicted PolB exonuclease-like 3'-5' exonuclease